MGPLAALAKENNSREYDAAWRRGFFAGETFASEWIPVAEFLRLTKTVGVVLARCEVVKILVNRSEGGVILDDFVDGRFGRTALADVVSVFIYPEPK